MAHASPRLGWLFLALYALFGATWGRGFVLCFEPDGHVSLEAGADCSSCCAEDGTEPGVPPSVDACPCSDLLISVSESVRARLAAESLDVPAPAFLGASSVPRPAPVVRAASGTRERTRSHASAALGALRTVVLLV